MPSNPVWKRAEREFANGLSDATGRDVVRRGHEESRAGNLGDLRTDGLPLAVQVRSGYRVNLREALRDAEEAATSTELAVAAVYQRYGRGKPADRLAVLSWQDFHELVGLLVASGAW